MTKEQNKHLKIISYNLKYHRAGSELAALVNRYQADILCVQECSAEQLPKRLGDLTLADKTLSGKLNLAIYYSKRRFQSTDNSSYLLKESLLERLYMPTMERLLVTELFDKFSQQQISIGSFHATHMIASNYLRRSQIKSAHAKLAELSRGSPAIMVGDYNYPLFKRGLKVCIEESGYQLSISDRPTYYLTRFLRAHMDFATSINTRVERVRTLPRGLSDHSPILIHVTI